MSKDLIVIALGGNAIKQADQWGTTEEQLRNVDVTAQQIAKIIANGYRVVVTHGNGPQAGALLIQQEEAEQFVPAQTLAACGAMTQGQIGWAMQNRLSYHLKKAGVKSPVCTVVTQVLVSDEDPDFKDPSKPVGPFYTMDEAKKLETEKKYIVKEVKPNTDKPWRRVVPSPEPIDIIEKDSVNALLSSGAIVIASGGGGIPVRQMPDDGLEGVDAVIDKDRAGFKLAQAVKADKFIILTDVENAYIRYNTPEQKALKEISIAEVEKYLEEGEFLKGSMGPKIEAAVRFVKWSKKEAIITSLHKALDALEGKNGTHIIP